MTVGQRIAQKRKEQNLSQEALGERLGVSRQSIYKWESDAALPEIDKLIALSRLYGVSVGWLLGVEPMPSEPAESPAEDPAELTEQQLKMVQEIANQYLAARLEPVKPQSRWGRRLLIAVCGLLVAAVLTISAKVDRLNNQYANLQNAVGNVESSVKRQIGGISSRVEEILKSQNNLTAEYGADILSADPQNETVTFSLYAVPKTYVDGMSAEFTAEDGSGTLKSISAQLGAGQKFSAELSCSLSDAVNLSVVFLSPDGTRQTQLLESFTDLYSSTLPSVNIMGVMLFGMPLEDGLLRLGAEPVSVRTDSAVNYYGSALPVASVQEIRVGLFCNHTLLLEAQPCERPEYASDAEDEVWFRFPAESVPVKDGDLLIIAALITDEYGRQFMEFDYPFCTPDPELEHLEPVEQQDSFSLSDEVSDWSF